MARLRLKHAIRTNYKSKGSPIITQLRHAITRLSPSQKQNERFQLLRSVVIHLDEIFKKLENLKAEDARSNAGVDLITTIIRNIHARLNFSDLQERLTQPEPKNSPWTGNDPADVIRRYQKLSQYVSAASHLRRIVLRFSNWQFCDVGNTFDRKQLSFTRKSTATNFLQRALTTGTKKEKKVFRNGLDIKLGKTYQAIESGIKSKATEEKCIHAEIQLLFYYLPNFSTPFQPRVLYSNKETCYLCNLFINTHGQFYTHKTHGVLHTKRRLPLVDEISFNKDVAKQTREVIDRCN